MHGHHDHTITTTDHTGAGRRPTPTRTRRRRLTATLLGVTSLVGLGLAGLGSPAGAVVDGRDTDIAETPYQVALLFDGGHGCGGSIVSDRVVVTAAHCTEGELVESLSILAGATDLDDEGQRIAVQALIEHPGYSSTQLGDVAVLVLAEPLEFNDRVQPIALATDDEVRSATTGIVSGWGALSESEEEGSPDTLQSAVVPMVSDEVCEISLGIDGATETCAGGTGTDSCYGDSGGPLAIEVDGEPRLAGITSWGDECGGDTPGAYADVPAFADMIEAAMDAPDEVETVRTGDAGGFELEPEDTEWFDGDDAEWDDADWDDAAGFICELIDG